MIVKIIVGGWVVSYHLYTNMLSSCKAYVASELSSSMCSKKYFRENVNKFLPPKCQQSRYSVM